MDILAAKRIIFEKYPHAHIERFLGEVVLVAGRDGIELSSTLNSDTEKIWIEAAKGLGNHDA